MPCWSRKWPILLHFRVFTAFWLQFCLTGRFTAESFCERACRTWCASFSLTCCRYCCCGNAVNGDLNNKERHIQSLNQVFFWLWLTSNAPRILLWWAFIFRLPSHPLDFLSSLPFMQQTVFPNFTPYRCKTWALMFGLYMNKCGWSDRTKDFYLLVFFKHCLIRSEHFP